MDRKLCNERYDLVLMEIHKGLCSLLSRTRHLTPGLDEIEKMVSSSSEIRQLLAELERMQVLSRDEALGRSLCELQREFLDLEGWLKEQRNDRLSEHGR